MYCGFIDNYIKYRYVLNFHELCCWVDPQSFIEVHIYTNIMIYHIVLIGSLTMNLCFLETLIFFTEYMKTDAHRQLNLMTPQYIVV